MRRSSSSCVAKARAGTFVWTEVLSLALCRWIQLQVSSQVLPAPVMLQSYSLATAGY